MQPLSGEYAGRRALLEELPFVQGYGVDLGLLIDIAGPVGTEAIAQVDLGLRVHRNRPLDELSPQALAVLQTAFTKAHVVVPRAHRATLVRPGLKRPHHGARGAATPGPTPVVPPPPGLSAVALS